MIKRENVLMMKQQESEPRNRTSFVSRLARLVTRPATHLLLLCSALVSTTVGAHAAMITVVHGINGSDLGLASNLPVDIAVNGSCAIKGLTFT